MEMYKKGGAKNEVIPFSNFRKERYQKHLNAIKVIKNKLLLVRNHDASNEIFATEWFLRDYQTLKNCRNYVYINEHLRNEIENSFAKLQLFPDEFLQQEKMSLITNLLKVTEKVIELIEDYD